MEQKDSHSEFQKRVSEKEKRMQKARREGKHNIWLGFGMFGLIGWSVAVPTVVFALLGIYLDGRYPGERSYTLALLVGGLMLGCLNAWYWVNLKVKEMEEEDQKYPDNERHQ